MVGRNAVAPPKLAADAPVADVLEPVTVGLDVALGMEADAPVLDGLECGLGEGFHAHEPLLGKAWLDGDIAALGKADFMVVLLDQDEVAAGFELGDDGLAGGLAGEATKALRHVVIHRGVIVHDVDRLEVMSLAHFVVIRVMRGRDFYGAGAEFRLNVVVSKYGDLTIDNWQDNAMADEVGVALVFRMYGDAGVAQHGLGPSGGDDDRSLAIDPVIADVPELAGCVFEDDFFVGEGGVRDRTPVNHPGALVDQALVIELDKDVADGFGELVVQGKALACPVAAATEGA